MEIRKRRIYDPPTARDGTRILVDDIWPRGISKQQARLDGCWRTLAPGKGLRQWFAHDPSRWEGFKERLLFVIEHGRRRIVHFNVTPNPTSAWVIQQLREAFPFDTAPRHLIFDRDKIFSPAVVRFVKAMGTKPSRTAYRCPWQNPVAERWIGSCRRELLEHVVVLGERHLVRLLRSYLEYYHADRSHLGLAKDAPDRRSVTPRPSPTVKVVALPRVGGLHHRYEWREAA